MAGLSDRAGRPRRRSFYASAKRGMNERAGPSDTNATIKRPPHTAGETGAFLKYSIGQQRAQSMSQSAAKSSLKSFNLPSTETRRPPLRHTGIDAGAFPLFA